MAMACGPAYEGYDPDTKGHSDATEHEGEEPSVGSIDPAPATNGTPSSNQDTNSDASTEDLIEIVARLQNEPDLYSNLKYGGIWVSQGDDFDVFLAVRRGHLAEGKTLFGLENDYYNQLRPYLNYVEVDVARIELDRLMARISVLWDSDAVVIYWANVDVKGSCVELGMPSEEEVQIMWDIVDAEQVLVDGDNVLPKSSICAEVSEDPGDDR